MSGTVRDWGSGAERGGDGGVRAVDEGLTAEGQRWRMQRWRVWMR
ncbi:hypothetical protein DSC45_30270 [Streptomyces sp. YIM 130001]|nr:hypothetical protein DSC45_30270 [Streptomyces sp. YIM 130001]